MKEKDLRDEILEKVKEYCKLFHGGKEFTAGETKIPFLKGLSFKNISISFSASSWYGLFLNIHKYTKNIWHTQVF